MKKVATPQQKNFLELNRQLSFSPVKRLFTQEQLDEILNKKNTPKSSKKIEYKNTISPTK